VQQDGTLHEYVGDIYRPRKTRMHSNTVKLWLKCYHQARNSLKRMSFNQARGWFFYQHHYWPPTDLPKMPVNEFDWYLPVADVPAERLKQ
jgi:hypothetical protein